MAKATTKKATKASRTTSSASAPARRAFEAAFVSIGDVHPYPRNPRKITDEAIAKVAASIEEYGWQQPIVVDTESVVVVGHVRLLAAQKLGLEEVPVRVASGLSPGQLRAYRLADNRAGEEAGWNRPLLIAELTELGAADMDLLGTGFDVVELDKLLKPAPEDDQKGEFDSPKPVPKYECPSCGYKWSGAES